MREMTVPAKVDKQGRITIPPVVRDTLLIEPGDVVEITVRKMELEEKDRDQSINPLEATETPSFASA